MAAEKQQKQKGGGSRFGRFRNRVAEATAGAQVHGRAFGPFVRLRQPANDNRMPTPLLLVRAAVLAALAAMAVSVML